MMPIYSWKSEALAGYIDGDIIALATSPSSARKKIREKAVKVFSHDKDKVERIINDISVEPDTSEVLFIYGSD